MDTRVMISIIVAMAENRVIGRAGKIPWRLSTDLKRFKTLTEGHSLIVGRKTHEAILRRLGHPLPKRRTIVLTRTPDYEAPSCEVATSWEEAIKQVRGEPEIFVIGGAEVYRHALPYAGRIFLTKVFADIAGDTLFPTLDETLWEECTSGPHEADAKNEYPYQFFVLNRRKRNES